MSLPPGSRTRAQVVAVALQREEARRAFEPPHLGLRVAFLVQLLRRRFRAEAPRRRESSNGICKSRARVRPRSRFCASLEYGETSELAKCRK